MNLQAKKIHFIEECLKINSSSAFDELNLALKKVKKKELKKQNIYDFLGIWNKKEAEEIKKAIHETSEQINEDDWK